MCVCVFLTPIVRENDKMMQVEYEEDGSGAGGYAKEMSDGWKEVRFLT